MSATTVDRDTPCLYPQRQVAVPLAAASVIPGGVIVCEDANGNAVNGSNTAGLKTVGRSEHSASQTAGDTTVHCGKGVYGFAGTAALIALGQAACEKRVYVADNQTVGILAEAACSAGVIAGVLEQIEGSTFFVNFQRGLDAADAVPNTLANAAISPAIAPVGHEIVMVLPIPDAATADIDFITPVKIEVTEVEVLKEGAGAGNTIQLKTGAGVAISDAIAAAVDKAKTLAGTLDVATRTVNALGTLRITATRAAGSMLCKVIVKGIRRA